MRVIKEFVRDVPKGESYRYSDAMGASFTVEGPGAIKITVTQERRAPDRHYKYGSSYDPRIRALERRDRYTLWDKMKDRRVLRDRRVSFNPNCEHYRRNAQRRKA